MFASLFLTIALVTTPAILPVNHYHHQEVHRQHMENNQRQRDAWQRKQQHRELLNELHRQEQLRRIEQRQRKFQRDYLD